MLGARALAWLLAGLVLSASLAVLAQSGGQSERRSRRHRRVTQGLACESCHSPSGWQMRVRMRTPKGFDHSRTGFPLSGRHRVARCVDCHRPEMPPGRACAGCHSDAHHGRMGQRCDDCHNSRGWDQLQVFDVHRDTRFPLTGMHALADCTECHRRVGERQWSTPPAECFGCHSDDYLSDDTHPVHRGDADQLPFPRTCQQCHQTTAWLPARFDPGLLIQPLAARASALRRAADHDRRFVISRGPHRGAACETCHVDRSLPSLVTCTGCHEHSAVRLARQHRGQPIAPTAGACTGCHLGGAGR